LSMPDKSVVTHVSISSCGNYVLTSSVSGKVFIFNLQSGILRKTLNIANEPLVASFTDSTSTFVISVSKSGVVSQVSLASTSLMATLALESEAAVAVVNRSGELVAVAGADHTIRVVDYAVMRNVRLLQGHRSHITDMVFSSDSKWLLSASRDMTIKTWDLPSGKLLDSVSTRSAPLSISFSKNLEFLASSHEDETSISIWANRSLFAGDCFSAESSWITPTLPLDAVMSSDSEVILSNFPPSRWKNIYFLEKIRANTKPVAAMTAKKSALPFFLGQALQQELNASGLAMHEKDSTIKVSTEAFTTILDSCMESNSLLAFAEHLLALQPSALDLEISCLGADRKVHRLVFMLQSMSAAIGQGSNFELLQAIVSVIFRHHDLFISDNLASFAEVLRKLDSVIENKWEPLEGLAQQCLCSIQFIREN
jgi:U3 small nucleolar RNA-associated protein 21